MECVPFLYRASYGGAGISVGGSVDTKVGKEGLKKSTNQVTEYFIRPNMMVSDELGQVLSSLQQLAAGESSSQSMEDLSKACFALLSGKNLDPVNAIVVPLESVNAVHSLFGDNPDVEVDHFPSRTTISDYSRCFFVFQDSRNFMKFLNGMFVKVKALLKQVLSSYSVHILMQSDSSEFVAKLISSRSLRMAGISTMRVRSPRIKLSDGKHGSRHLTMRWTL